MRATSIAIIIAALALSACSSHVASLNYEGQTSTSPLTTVPLVASVYSSDDRGTESNWLGAIRGGYGNPLKKIYTDRPAATVVTDIFLEALQANGMLGTPETSDKTVEIGIAKLDCSYYFNREAHAHINVTVLTLPDRVSKFTRSYKTDNTEGGVGAGIFGDVDYLVGFAQKTLNETIEKVLTDPSFLAALSSDPPALTSNLTNSGDRLRQLEQLHRDGLVSDSEYEAKRSEILKDL